MIITGMLAAVMPLLGFLIIQAFTKKHHMLSAYVSIAMIAASFTMAVLILLGQLKTPGMHNYSLPWMHIGSVEMNIGFMINQLTSVMLVIVTFVSMLVQIYSIGYMHGDDGFSKFFSFISLFSFSMLGVVVSNNLMQIYIFWELVGLCSYLLIGFWYTKPEASDAAKKAFVVNRVGDFGFLLGIIFLSTKAGTFDFIAVEEYVKSGAIDPNYLTVIVLLLFCGALGKSAQFPMHVWLPDAMEGPTPVSALIHAATMVAAGVFMVARLFGIFVLSPGAMLVVAYIGGFTAIFAASIALTQDDIKRVLAYSTVSQLGYMVMALGVGGYTAGMFHLTTHAFFKALLFLGAGSVIHGVHTNNIWDMGGLHKKMPVTSVTFLIAALAISGIFPLAGFWSKDEILVATREAGMPLLYYTALITAFMTAFYMFRLYIVTFLGKEKGEASRRAHESPLNMTVPLMILALMSVVAGFAGVPGQENSIYNWLYHGEHPHETHFNMPVAITSTVVAVTGILLAFAVYFFNWIKAENLKKASGPLYALSKNKFYIDEIYLFLIKRCFFTIAEAVKWFDKQVVDGVVNMAAFVMRWSGRALRNTMTGRVQDYALVIFGGAVAAIVAFAIYNPAALQLLGGR
ncbi:MAG: NADH-quinone oxidoreductase subunit L [Spirochaetia bacterium]|nr:NADH-quinone oxidoreductase subunit L [Spirochaetia bacterium]